MIKWRPRAEFVCIW